MNCENKSVPQRSEPTSELASEQTALNQASDHNPQAYWLQRYNKISTTIGKWIGGEEITIREHKLLGELFNNVSYMQLHALNVTGRMISPQLGKWLENNFMVMSYPDARIWCNNIGALTGDMSTSPVAGTVAGVLASDSRVYGGNHTAKLAMTFLQQALVEYKQGKSIADIVNSVAKKQGKPALMGFARPINRTDERIEPHRKMSAELGFEVGEYMQLANQLDAYVTQHYQLGINIGGYTSAFLLDQGFSADEVYALKALCVNSGVTACYVDYKAQPKDSFLPLKCADIHYQGKAPRSL
ncbi:hypothetical protein [Algibacillus agarilyticus]|uniref:hypothetical protein n=1 Tax=Algibacillus agarilyticus TaxID=2234133 RepID=UPI000DCF8C36|nr:hypothetical protein [Algibacillus agarilyticus]